MDRSGAEPTVLQNRRAHGRAADAYVAGFAHSHDQELRSFCRFDRRCASYDTDHNLIELGARVFQVRALRVA